MKIVIIGGFLGSGKTSVILQAAHYLVEKRGLRKVAILENEIGEIGVDDLVLKGAGYQVRGMFAGCVCCTLAGELPTAVAELEQDEAPDVLIIETTGVAFPYSVLESLERVGRTAHITCVTDAKRWRRLFVPMQNLFVHQMMRADTVLVNKADLLDEETLREVAESVKTISGDAEVFTTNANGEMEEEILRKVIGE